MTTPALEVRLKEHELEDWLGLFTGQYLTAPLCYLLITGDMGSGKTTLIRQLFKILGVSERVKSPTFDLTHAYSIPAKNLRLYHCDFYRLNTTDDFMRLGFVEDWEGRSDCQTIVAIEWPQLAEDKILKRHWLVQCEIWKVAIRNLDKPTDMNKYRDYDFFLYYKNVAK